MSKAKRLNTPRYTIIICIILLVLSIGFSTVFIVRSRNTVKQLVSERMLEIASSAAAIIDGDLIKTIDKDTPKNDPNYQELYGILDKFKANVKFKYIYIVKYDHKDETGQNVYTFVIDQDPEDPALFGENVVYTEALNKASNGEPAVDMDAYTDRWGSFYSAFSPIKDSNGDIVGVVGIDFESLQYEDEVSRQSSGIILVSVFSLFVGGIIALLFSSQVLKRFNALNKELTALSRDIDSLNEEISVKQSEVYLEEDNNEEKNENDEKDGKDSVEDLVTKMSVMQQELRRYIDYVHAQAYIDSMTGVSSKTAYLELVKDIENRIVEKTADFKVIVFDVNGLKAMNDNYGHEFGDMLIINTSKVILSLYDRKQVFRIGGDEFIVIILDETDKTLEENEFDINQAIDEFNAHLKDGDVKVSCSFGGAHYNPRIDDSFKNVFKRADEEMYHYKALFYQKNGDRRKH